MIPKIFRREIYRGDAWTQTVTVEKAGFTWPSDSVTAKIKSDVDGSTLHTFTPSTSVSTNTLTITLALTGAESAALTVGEAFLDVQVSATGFGPHTPVRFTLDIVGDITV